MAGKDGLACILDRYAEAPPPALAVRRRGLPALAAAYGDPSNDRLYSGCCLCRTLVARALALTPAGG